MGSNEKTPAEVREMAKAGLLGFKNQLTDFLGECPSEDDGVREFSDTFAGCVASEIERKGGTTLDTARFFASLLAEAVMDGKGGGR